MLGLKSLFRQEKNRTYDYQPRYWDERKERLENLENKYHSDNVKKEQYTMDRRALRAAWNMDSKKSERSFDTRFLKVAVVLFTITYIILRYDIFSVWAKIEYLINS
jgi:hypothetical protein